MKNKVMAFGKVCHSEAQFYRATNLFLPNSRFLTGKERPFAMTKCQRFSSVLIQILAGDVVFRNLARVNFPSLFVSGFFDA